MSTAYMIQAIAPGESHQGRLLGASAQRTLQATLTGTGTVHAKVLVEDSNDAVGWHTVATITLDGSNQVSERSNYVSAAEHYRATVLELTGTAAGVNVSVSY